MRNSIQASLPTSIVHLPPLPSNDASLERLHEVAEEQEREQARELRLPCLFFRVQIGRKEVLLIVEDVPLPQRIDVSWWRGDGQGGHVQEILKVGDNLDVGLGAGTVLCTHLAYQHPVCGYGAHQLPLGERSSAQKDFFAAGEVGRVVHTQTQLGIHAIVSTN